MLLVSTGIIFGLWSADFIRGQELIDGATGAREVIDYVSRTAVVVIIFLALLLLANLAYSVVGERAFNAINWPFSLELDELFKKPSQAEIDALGPLFERNQLNLQRLFREKLKYRVSANNNILTGLIISLLTIVLIIEAIESVKQNEEDARGVDLISICEASYQEAIDSINAEDEEAEGEAEEAEGDDGEAEGEAEEAEGEAEEAEGEAEEAEGDDGEAEGEAEEAEGDDGEAEGEAEEAEGEAEEAEGEDEEAEDSVTDDGATVAPHPFSTQKEKAFGKLQICLEDVKPLQADVDALQIPRGAKSNSEPTFWSQLTPENLFGVLTRLIVIFITQSLSFFFLKSYQRCMNRVNALTDEISLVHRKAVALGLLAEEMPGKRLSEKDVSMVVKRFLNDDTLERRKAIAKVIHKKDKKELSLLKSIAKGLKRDP